MRKLLAVFLTGVLAALAFAGCGREAEFTFRPTSDTAGGDVAVVSFNCAAPWGNALKGTGSGTRVKRFAEYMNTVRPDSLGTQEMNGDWMEKLEQLMPDYDSYGVRRGGDDSEKKSEMNSVFWLRDKYDCVDKGTFWLSETPDKESRYNGAGCNRVCTYVVLRDRESGRQYIHMNTHLDNASDEARVFGAGVITQRIAQLREQYPGVPIVLSGDFNDYIDGPACSVISQVLSANPADVNTYHDWGKYSDGQPIDFIFTDAKASGCIVLNDTSNGFISDHYGIYETISF